MDTTTPLQRALTTSALLLICGTSIIAQTLANSPINGTKCARNQVINKLTVYEDGAIEAECGPMPCGVSGERCIDDQSACRADTDIFSGMKWAANGQSLLLRCCSFTVPNKVYVGTDLVTLGSYYTGGAVANSDKYEKSGGTEYDYVVNVRNEQGGVRVWVYRIICLANQQQQHQLQQQQQFQQQPRPQQQQSAVEEQRQQQADEAAASAARRLAYEKRREFLQKQIAESQDAAPAAEQQQEEEVANPLQYRPQQHRQRDAPTERLL